MLKIEIKNNFSDTEAVCNRGDSKKTQTETHNKLQLQLTTQAFGYGKIEDIKVNLLLGLKNRSKETHFVPSFTEQRKRESSKPERIQRKEEERHKDRCRERRKKKKKNSRYYYLSEAEHVGEVLCWWWCIEEEDNVEGCVKR